jgi:hypothetical protein
MLEWGISDVGSGREWHNTHQSLAIRALFWRMGRTVPKGDEGARPQQLYTRTGAQIATELLILYHLGKSREVRMAYQVMAHTGGLARMSRRARSTDKNLRDCSTKLSRTLRGEKILSALPKMAKAAQSKDLKAAFEQREAETQEHVDRLEKVFEVRAPLEGIRRYYFDLKSFGMKATAAWDQLPQRPIVPSAHVS